MAISIKNSPPTAGTYGITSSNSATNMMPNCTGYAFYRAYDEFGSFPVTSMVNAELGLGFANEEDDGKAYYDSNGVPGDVLVYHDHHVAFVEGDGEISESALCFGYQNTSGQKIELNRGLNALSFYNNELAPNGSRPAYTVNGGGPYQNDTVRRRFGSKNSSTIGASNYAGRLHQESNQGGGGHEPGGGDDPTPGWVKDERDPTGVYGETVCGGPDDRISAGSQFGPRIPTIYSQEREDAQKEEGDADPGDPSDAPHGRTNRRWEPFNAYTYERELRYEKNDQGIYVGKGSDGKLIDSSSHYGSIAGYDTAIEGPLAGGNFDGNNIHGD